MGTTGCRKIGTQTPRNTVTTEHKDHRNTGVRGSGTPEPRGTGIKGHRYHGTQGPWDQWDIGAAGQRNYGLVECISLPRHDNKLPFRQGGELLIREQSNRNSTILTNKILLLPCSYTIVPWQLMQKTRSVGL